MARVYHKFPKDDAQNILTKGLVVGARGANDDEDIERTDEFLNGLIPPYLKQNGVDRHANIYCYLSDGDRVIDITTGEKKLPSQVLEGRDESMVRVEVRPEDCYVSDLDLFDEVMALLCRPHDADTARRLGCEYWQKLQPLPRYDGTIRRPEVLITSDIPPANLTQVA